MFCFENSESLFAEVIEGERGLGDLRANQLNGFLQAVALGAGHANDVALKAGAQLQCLGFFDQRLDLFAQILVNAALDDDELFERVAGGLFHGLGFVQEAYVDVALGQFSDQYVAYLFDLKIGVADDGQFELFLFDGGRRAAEVETGGNFFLSLIDRILQFDGIGFEQNVKTRHGNSLCKMTRNGGEKNSCGPYCTVPAWEPPYNRTTMTHTNSLRLDVRENVELAPYTTFGVHAVARFFVEPKTTEELTAVLRDERFLGLPRLILGGGSNILFTRDFDGIVIRPRMDALELIDENDEYRFVRIGAGADWTRTVAETLERGWNGLENLSLIPGTVGGAAVQNIGAYGLEIAERIVEVECLNPETLQILTLGVDECDYGYRTSTFKHEPNNALIVLSVTLSLPKRFEPIFSYKELAHYFGEQVPTQATEVAQAVIALRRKKLPDPAELGSAGSFFKNPVVSRVKVRHLLEDEPRLVTYQLGGGRAKLAAGWLIDAVGMKGKRRGDAGVYERQALVLVNHGQASGAEIKALADEVAAAVKRRFGVELEPEPVII